MFVWQWCPRIWQTLGMEQTARELAAIKRGSGKAGSLRQLRRVCLVCTHPPDLVYCRCVDQEEASMIRTVRVFQARRGHVEEVIELLREIQAYSETQGVEERIFVEPWGDATRVHIHYDHADMSKSQEDWERMHIDNARAQAAQDKLDVLTEPNPRIHLLLER